MFSLICKRTKKDFLNVNNESWWNENDLFPFNSTCRPKIVFNDKKIKL